MNRLWTALLATGLALPLCLAPSTTTAQEWQVARDQFPFAGSRLEILIEGAEAGTLRLLRGEPGNVRVAGRAVTGFTSAGLTADEHLTLSALSDGPVEYMVTVPEGVWITVRFPDRPMSESLAGHARGATYHWGAGRQSEPADAPGADDAPATPLGTHAGATPGRPAPAPPAASGPMPAPGAAAGPAAAADAPALAQGGVGVPLFTTYAGHASPAEVDLPDLSHVRSVTLRVEGDRFRVAASRPLAVRPGDPARLVIRPAAPPMDLVIVIPQGTPSFQLHAGGALAARIADHDITTYCSPSTRLWLSHGRRWVTFTPVEGVLECGPVAPLRHEG